MALEQLHAQRPTTPVEVTLDHFDGLMGAFARQGRHCPEALVPAWYQDTAPEARRAAVEAWLRTKPQERRCSEAGCRLPHYGLGLCRRHYRQLIWELRS